MLAFHLSPLVSRHGLPLYEMGWSAVDDASGAGSGLITCQRPGLEHSEPGLRAWCAQHREVAPPTFVDVFPALALILSGQEVVCYDAAVTVDSLQQVCTNTGLPMPDFTARSLREVDQLATGQSSDSLRALADRYAVDYLPEQDAGQAAEAITKILLALRRPVPIPASASHVGRHLAVVR